jgi:phytoene dehydrogenase-like protein
MERELPTGDDVDGLFLTVTSLKDPGHAPQGHHTIEMFIFAPWEPFARHRAAEPGARSAAYGRLKRELADKMLRTAERLVPGLRKHLRFLEVGSPLTNDFYCASHRGAVYGTAKTPWQLGPLSFSQRGPVDGLHLCGSCTIAHGVAGASMSGLVAAQHVLGLRTIDDCLGPADGSLVTVAREDVLPARRVAPRARPMHGLDAVGWR